MTAHHISAKAEIENDERLLARLPLDGRTLHDLALVLLKRAPAPICVKIVLGRRTVAMLAQDGTNGDNERFLDLKLNTVFNCGHSSLWWFHHLRGTGRTLAEVNWADPAEVIDMGGGVPLTAHDQVVGAVAISGLPHEDDHALIIAAAAEVMATAQP
jgi:uncharacterized protein (UPF0303 family)